MNFSNLDWPSIIIAVVIAVFLGHLIRKVL